MCTHMNKYFVFVHYCANGLKKFSQKDHVTKVVCLTNIPALVRLKWESKYLKTLKYCRIKNSHHFENYLSKKKKNMLVQVFLNLSVLQCMIECKNIYRGVPWSSFLHDMKCILNSFPALCDFLFLFFFFGIYLLKRHFHRNGIL